MWIIFPELRHCPIYPPPPVNTATFLPLPPATLSLSNTVTTWDWCAFASSIGETGALTARDELLSSSIFYDFPALPMQRIMRGSTRYRAMHWWTTSACQRPLSCLLFCVFLCFFAFRQFYTKSANFSPKFIYCSGSLDRNTKKNTIRYNPLNAANKYRHRTRPAVSH